MADTTEENQDPVRFREVLGAFCSGITVITAIDADGVPLGLTCQSFISLSLAPPLVLFAPARTSTTWPQIRTTGGFCVNVLAEEQREVSTAMARSGADKFAGVTWEPSQHGSPRLPGAAAWIDCTLHAEHDGGDHTIVIGSVRGLDVSNQAPLLYHRGDYASLCTHSAETTPSGPSIHFPGK